MVELRLRARILRFLMNGRIKALSRLTPATLAMSLFCSAASAAEPHGKAEHVIMVVWDGMRPDFITPEHTPTLFQLAQTGVFFKNHHPVYISSTEVNATALNTGDYPEHSDIAANKEYRPTINKTTFVAMEDLQTKRRGDELTGGHYIAAPTLSEILQQNGYSTAVCGTKSVALLLDRAEQRTTEAAEDSIDFFNGRTFPTSAMPLLLAANQGKSFPGQITHPNVAQDEWTTRALTLGLWKNQVPKFSVLWMSDPDFTQHPECPGSPAALAALKSIDHDLATVLKTLEEKRLREKTDIFIVSDHGFSTVERTVDLVTSLNRAGFSAGRKFDAPKNGDIMVVGLGGSVFLYVVGHDALLISKVARFLQSCNFSGVIFSRIPVQGTFSLQQVRLDTADAPDLVCSLRWSSGTNAFGTPGLITADLAKKGSHASLSRFDMHNTLVAAGPDFHSGFVDSLPTGNTDLAPTILWTLGVRSPVHMDGRILDEALIGRPTPPAATEETVRASYKGEDFLWSQYLNIRSVGSTVYFDEGNGSSITR